MGDDKHRRIRAEVEDIIRDSGPVMARADHPDRANTLDWAARIGILSRPLPGIYVPTAMAHTPAVQIAAALRYRPDGVLVGEAAASLTFWPELTPTVISVAAPSRVSAPGFHFTRRRIPEAAITVQAVGRRHTFRLCGAAYSAVDLSYSLGGEAIDRALRSRLVRISDLWFALQLLKGTKGNVSRRRLLLESRDEPWSAAERLAHHVFRAAGIRGWRANFAIRLAGRLYYLDIAFPGLKVAIEVDGRFHDSEHHFESDRIRDNSLQAAGWIVLRFTWHMLVSDPEFVVATVRAVLARARRRLAS